MLLEPVLNKFSKAKEILDWVRHQQIKVNPLFKALNLHLRQLIKSKERIVYQQNNTPPFMYTEEQLMARLKFFIGICLALTLTGIVFVVLYSIIFITQPLNAISPIDSKFFEMIIPIATFLTGTLSGIMLAGGDKDLQAKALDAANRQTPVSPTPSTPNVSPSFSSIPSSAPTGFSSPPSFTPSPAPIDNSIGGPIGGPISGFGGKLAPPPAPQPLI
jgi:hypothetical protein